MPEAWFFFLYRAYCLHVRLAFDTRLVHRAGPAYNVCMYNNVCRER